MAWEIPRYTVQEVNKAAKFLVSLYTEGTEFNPEFFAVFDHSLEIVNNWRAAHNFPLNTFQVNLRNSSKKISEQALVAQRTKRLASILTKLERSPMMKLSQMQDIGGCRAVIPTVRNVYELWKFYTDTSRMKHELVSTDNYIANPKESGYRGVHLVYRYRSDRNETYDGLKIEMQLRSQFQHAWATAVEAAGMFRGEALKTSIGDGEWLRFFSLMGAAIAMRERTAPVPGTPGSREELVEELKFLSDKLSVVARMGAIASALNYIESGEVENAAYFLLELYPASNFLKITGFKKNQLEAAERDYARAERSTDKDEQVDAVLVSVNSVQTLHRAYPNYFADTSTFLKLHDQFISGVTRRIGMPKPLARRIQQRDLFENIEDT